MPRENIAELMNELCRETEAALKENPGPEVRAHLKKILTMLDEELNPKSH